MEYNVSIIGAGTMGVGIAKLLITSSVVRKLNLVTKQDRVELVREDLSKYCDKQFKKGRVSKEIVHFLQKNLTVTDEIALIRDSDLVIEAISEYADQKKKLFTDIAGLTNDQTIIASNTSSLSITEISVAYKAPNKVIGLHFFNPATVMRLNEVIVGLATDEQTLNKVLNFSRLLGKEPVIVNESPGFIVNRMLIPMINEAVCILAEGVASADDIDKAMKLGANHPMGPLHLADFIGNDVNLSIMETLFRETGDPKYRPHPLLRKMVRANHLGRKTQQGFFDYR